MTDTATRYAHQLEGLQPEPLASYLSGLGVLRLIHEQVDPDATCWWENNHLVLETSLKRPELLEFFLNDYQPTPLTSPWNGGSGYYGNDKKDGIEAILESESARFAPYRQTLCRIKNLLQKIGADEKPPPDEKPVLLKRLRAVLDDHSLKWLDATLALGETESSGKTKVSYAPLLGTGGNDGRLEFSNNFMQRLAELFLNEKAKPKQTRELLNSALFGEVGRYLKKSPVGQFDPGSAGGVNLSVGFEGNALVNPWYYILMIEGAVTLATAAVGRFQSGTRVGSAFPFTVSHIGSGHGKLAPEEGNRQEIWLPLWERPARYAEIRHLFAEGRAQNGHKQARNPVEFSLALATHGTSRGLSGFSRFGFLQRNGKSYFATPLGYYPVGARDGASLIRRLERWFSAYRGVISAHSAGSQRLLNRYDGAVLEYLKTANRRALTTVLEGLGDFHLYLARTPKLCEKIRPLPEISEEWAELGNDDTPEFRLALSLSTLGAGVKASEFNLRAQLTPYDARSRRWDPDDHIERWVGRDLAERMVNLLEHRMREADRVGFVEEKGFTKRYNSPIRGSVGAQLPDIEKFLTGSIDDQRLEKLLFALILLRNKKPKLTRNESATFLGLPFILPKLALHQGFPLRLGLEPPEGETLKDDRDVRIPPRQIVRMLATGNVLGALKASRRFLLTRPLVVEASLIQPIRLSPDTLRRTAAALLLPIDDRTYFQLYNRIAPTNTVEESEETQHD